MPGSEVAAVPQASAQQDIQKPPDSLSTSAPAQQWQFTMGVAGNNLKTAVPYQSQRRMYKCQIAGKSDRNRRNDVRRQKPQAGTAGSHAHLAGAPSQPKCGSGDQQVAEVQELDDDAMDIDAGSITCSSLSAALPALAQVSTTSSPISSSSIHLKVTSAALFQHPDLQETGKMLLAHVHTAYGVTASLVSQKCADNQCYFVNHLEIQVTRVLWLKASEST